MNRIYLVRHAENLASLTSEFSYRLVDCSLNIKECLQTQQTAEVFIDKNIADFSYLYGEAVQLVSGWPLLPGKL